MTEEEKKAIENVKLYLYKDKAFITADEIDLVFNLIQKQDTEINKLNNVIDRMAEMINSHDIDEDICSQFGKTKDCSLYINDEKACINCIKEYFMKEK